MTSSLIRKFLKNKQEAYFTAPYIKKQELTHLSIHSILDFIYPMCYKVNSVYQIVFVK